MERSRDPRRDGLCGDAGPVARTAPYRVLVNMECSGAIRGRLRARGIEAWSCDLKPAEDGGPHIQGDGYEVAYWGCWDAMIAHPVCTKLSNSGNKHLYLGMRKENGINPVRWSEMEAAAADFLRLWNAPIARVALENPIMSGHGKARVGITQTQIIQPWMFGHLETKATCLWLRGFPQLTPTHDVYEAMMRLPYAERAKVHCMPPGPNRQADRSRTYPGIADAVVDQWFAREFQLREAA